MKIPRPRPTIAATLAATLLLGSPRLLFAQQDSQETVSVSVEPATSEKPTEVLLIPRGGFPTPMTLDAGSDDYTAHMERPVSPAWQMRYTIVATWRGSDGHNHNEQIYILVNPAVRSAIDLRVFHETPDPDIDTLDRIENLGPDLMSLLEEYFVARDVYRTALSTQVKQRALRDWYDAAFTLPKNYSYIAPDSEVMALAERATKDASYFKLMNQQLRTMEFSQVALVPQLQKAGNLQLAMDVNNFFSRKIEMASPETRELIHRTQGVTVGLLKGNEKFLATLGTTR